MKKILITIIIAIIVGASLGIYSYRKFIDENIVSASKTNDEVYAFQVGAFDNYDNANTLAKKYGGVVIIDNNKYRVYIAIASDSVNILKKYFDDKNIAYYLKTIDVSNEFFTTLKEYETLLINSSDDTYLQIIKNILKEYEKSENMY